MMEPWYRRPKTQRKLSIVALVVLLFALQITFAPSYFARYFIASTLDDFGIEYEGIKTIKVNLWKREVWVGPVKFYAGQTDPGQLGELGFKLRVFPTFKKHAMVERVIVRGIDLAVVLNDDNTITVNGISPSQFQPATSSEAKTSSKTSTPWGVGLVDFDMQQCRLVFINQADEKLNVDIDSLQLANFASWRPEDPGTIALKATTSPGLPFLMNG